MHLCRVFVLQKYRLCRDDKILYACGLKTMITNYWCDFIIVITVTND